MGFFPGVSETSNFFIGGLIMEKFKLSTRKSFQFFLAIGFFVVTGYAQAATEKSTYPIADVYYDSSGIVWNPTVKNYESLLLTVFGPEGVSFEETFRLGQKPVFDRLDNCGQIFPDGSCVYELRLIPIVNAEIQEILAKRRIDICTPLSQEALALQTSVVQSGAFTLLRGEIVVGDSGDKTEYPDGDGLNSQAKANDIGHLNDVYIDGSLCLGNDCVDNTDFNFDTQIFMENNLRIYFHDTSTLASYPRNDWRIVINDSTNGGGSYFSVFDAGENGGESTKVFTLEAGAPGHSLYVDDVGRVGFGTATPSVELHTVDGDTPTLRLQQDGSSGFAPQTWDVAGNESNFFVRDVTNGSLLPFRIFPGTPSSTLTLNSSGNVGIGTTSPEAAFDVRSSYSHFGPNGGNSYFFNNTLNFSSYSNANSGGWINYSGYDHGIAQFRDLTIGNGKNTAVAFFDGSSGNVGIGTTTPSGKLDVNGSIYQRGGVLHADYVFEPGYKLESIDEHADFMFNNKHLKAVPKAKADENGIEIVEVGTHRRGILEELEKAHIYIHQLSSQNKELEKRLAMLEALIVKNNGTAANPTVLKK
jgi:hypothetical protein